MLRPTCKWLQMLVVLAALGGIALSGCAEHPDTIYDGPPPTLDAGIDSTAETDAGHDGQMLDICQQQSPPPTGAYTLLTTPIWTCGQSSTPFNHDQWSTQGTPWQSTVRVQAMDTMCGVTLPGYVDNPMDYQALTVMRAGADGPRRFYFGIPGADFTDVEFVCVDPQTIPVPASNP
jgi:hypothetical protein